MRNLFKAALCALVIGAVGQAAAAPVDHEAQVRRYLSDQAAKHAQEGYRADTPNADLVRVIDTEQSVLWPINLRRGQRYRVLAVCDNNCSDVDMELYDVSGNYVGADITVTDKPYVEIAPLADGVAYARVWLAACETDTCAIAARVYRKAQ